MDRLHTTFTPAAPVRPTHSRPVDAQVETLNKTLEQVKQMVSRLDGHFQEISSISGLIGGLSKHSNLLALNAAIEAARAGEAGRGFTVVADEVRRLSERTSSAAGEISRMIGEIQSESEQAVSGVEQAERDAVIQTAALMAEREAARLERRFERMASSLRGVKLMIEGMKAQALIPRREDVNAAMAEILHYNTDLLALSCGCEPQAFDGLDADYVSAPGHDASGRFVPYWHRGEGQLALEPLANYDKAGDNDFYELPRTTRQDVLMEPYLYPVGGKTVLMTSLMMPLMVHGRFMGVVGADYGLSQLQQEFAAMRLFGIGTVALISNGGIYVTHTDPARLGRPADDLPESVRAAIRDGHPAQIVAGGKASVFQPFHIGGVDVAWSMRVMFDLDEALGSV
jgi:methyl-accepting chemotaxis protein